MKVLLWEIIVLWLTIVYYYIEAIFTLIFPPAREDVSGKKVLITGAGHGIGREFSLEFARLGATLVLWDINKRNNEETANEARDLGATVHTYECDISSADNVHQVATQVQREVGPVHVLVNNAGILYGGPLLDMQVKHIKRTFEVNTLAHFWTVKEFLPAMMEANCGHILNIASGTAKSGFAFLVDYSSSKYAVFGFTEALSEEIEALGKTGVKTTVVCPAFVDTGLVKYVKDRFNKPLTPKETALASIDGMLRGEKVVYVPKRLGIMVKLGVLLPQKAGGLLKKFGGLGIEPQYDSSSS